MLDCQHASQLLSQAMERRLPWRQRISLRLHLMICDACTQFSRQLTLLRTAVGQLAGKIENDETLKLSDEARQRIVQAIQHPDQHS